jgi:hypothetical protein
VVALRGIVSGGAATAVKNFDRPDAAIGWQAIGPNRVVEATMLESLLSTFVTMPA